MLGTSILPTEVAEQISLIVIQVQERMTMLENQAPSYSFKDRNAVRNRYNKQYSESNRTSTFADGYGFTATRV